MNKSKWNFIIDAIMFVLMGAVAGLGLLIKYVLLSGTERWLKYGRNVNLTFAGLDRHDWGEIHLIFGIILIGLLIVHIILHWKMIVCLYKKVISNKTLRIICAFVFCFITIVSICFPFIIRVEINKMTIGKERFTNSQKTAPIEDKISKDKEFKHFIEQSNTNKSYKEQSIQKYKRGEYSIEVKGYMTLLEVSNMYKIPCEQIKNKLGIPSKVSNNSKLGHLRNRHNFKMSDLELIIANYRNKKP